MDFNALLQQAQRLANEAKSGQEYPRVDRTIGQVLQATQELHSRVTQTGSTKDIQAHILLGSKGIDLPKLTQKLDSLSARKTFEPLDPIGDTDIQSFLKNERENSILSVIDEVNRNLYESSRKIKWNSIKSDWNREKARLLNSLVGPSQDFIDIQRLPEQTVFNESCATVTRLNYIEVRYATAVHEYNDIVLKGGYRPNLVQIFGRVAEQFKMESINDMWSALVHMVDITPLSRNTDPIKTRQNTPHFVSQAKTYLERRYKIYMTSIVKGNLRTAQRGGVPSTYNLVNAFVTVNFNALKMIGLVDTVHSLPLWPLVYYSMRCGELKAAIQYLHEAGNAFEEFRQALEDKLNHPDQKINGKLESQLKLQYSNKIKNSTDPYKKTSYCILLGCDSNDQHPEVARTIDDFLWIQLSLLLIQHNHDHHLDQLSYPALQTLILEKYGESYFNASEQAHVYFQVLVLTGQFEAAIEFLARSEKTRVHAVHMAMALNELCILGGPRSVDQPLLSVDIEDPQPLRRLNLARLIMLYVKSFETTDTAEAMHYYFFLRNYKDSEGRNLFLQCICDLAIETGAYELIFGKLDPEGSGQIIGGLFERFNSVNFDTAVAAAMVAKELVNRGMFEKAVLLYDIAGVHNLALKHLSALLSQVVHQKEKGFSMRNRLAIEASKFNARIQNHQIEAESQIQSTFCLLYELLTFFDYFHDGKYRLALEVLARTKLVPMNIDELDECLINFRRLGGEVCKTFPDVMLSTMTIIYKQYLAAKKDANNEQQLRVLREQAKALNNMAATVPYRMPGDTNRRLVEMEILMH